MNEIKNISSIIKQNMKCKTCSFIGKTIADMGKHYREKHPSAMKGKRGKNKMSGLKKYKGMIRGLPKGAIPFLGGL
jgi:hypothetical protein